MVQFTVQIPDDIARRLSETGGDLSRRALESLALEEFKNGHITKRELRQWLGFDNRYALDDFLKLHGVVEDYTVEEIERQVDTLQRLGF